MPITPRFHLSQTETHLLVEVIVQHIRVTSIQAAVTNDPHLHSTLHLVAPPIYVLRLQFPPACALAPLDEEESIIASPLDNSLSQVVNGKVTIPFRKLAPGVLWKDLDLLGKLTVDPRGIDKKTSRWIREVESVVEDGDADNGGEDHCADNETVSTPKGLYGFGRMFCEVYSDATRDGLAKEMLDLPWDEDDELSVKLLGSTDERLVEIHAARRKRRLEQEINLFDPDRYLGDLMGATEDPLWQNAMEYRPFWEDSELLSDEEQLELTKIPYPLLPAKLPSTRLIPALLDILFAFVYDHMFTTGDPTVESAWTISTLSAALSTLEDYIDEQKIDQVVLSSIRRSLVIPYWRHLDWALMVWRQVSKVLSQGRRGVVRCFLRTRSILNCSELHYLGNVVWIDPYLAWMQKTDDGAVLDELLQSSATMILSFLKETKDCLKHRVGLDLLNIEAMVLADDPLVESPSDASDTDESSTSTASSETDAKDEELDSQGESMLDISRELLDLNLQDDIQAKFVISQANKLDFHDETTSQSPRALIQEVTD